MSRLIDADAFKEKYGNYYVEEGTAEGFIGTVGQLIDNAPIVSDRYGEGYAKGYIDGSTEADDHDPY